MNSEANKLTVVALGLFLVLLITGALGFCGRPSDHQPKPGVSSSTEKGKKSPAPITSSIKVR